MKAESTPIPLRNQVEATIVDAILKEDGIPHVIRSYHDRAYSGIWQFQNGWGHIEAPQEYKSGIRALLAVLRTEIEDFRRAESTGS